MRRHERRGGGSFQIRRPRRLPPRWRGHDRLDFGNDDAPTQPYVAEFSEWMHKRIHSHDIEARTAYRDQAPHAARAHPTTEHLLPLFVALGAADGEDRVTHLDPGTTFGVLAMDAFAFGGEI
jgi:4,5-DOPA dioxygenase extradiol